jgi:hypothetical protein
MNANRKLALFKDVLKFIEEEGRTPTLQDIADMGVPRRTLRRYFGDLGNLIEEILNSQDEHLFTDTRADVVRKSVKSFKKFFITTAVVGAPVMVDALASVENWEAYNNGKLLIMPSADPAANVSDGLDKLLLDRDIVFENTDLNSNIALYALRLSAKQINPTTGLGRFGQRNKSFIFASPKQSLEYVPVGNNSLPHALMTTGAITLPAYDTERFMSKRTAFIAENDHVQGGLIVEIVDEVYYHFREVQFNSDGSFTDLGWRYYPDGSRKFFPVLVLTLGDRHVRDTCEMVKKVTDRMIDDLKPKNIVLHDLANGDSVNHWLQKTPIAKARIDIPTIIEEGNEIRQDIESLSRPSNDIWIVKSNHDEWLDRYLEDFRFKDDSVNLEIALRLALDKLNKKDVLESLLRNHCGLRDKSVHFLKRDQDLIFNKVQYGCHGDKNHKGMSLDEIEKAFGNATVGHSHTAARRRGVRKVGTSTALRKSYAIGPISWTNTHEVHNADGSRQLVNIINGQYKL